MLRKIPRSRFWEKEWNSSLLLQVYTLFSDPTLPPLKLITTSWFDSYDHFSIHKVGDRIRDMTGKSEISMGPLSCVKRGETERVVELG